MGNSLCASSRKDANGFSWFRKAPDANARPMFRESAIVRKAREERKAREVREQREQALETAIEGGVKGIASELLRTTDSEVVDKLLTALTKEDMASPALVKGELASTVMDALFRVAEVSQPDKFRPRVLHQLSLMAREQALSPRLIEPDCLHRILKLVSAHRTHLPTVFWGFSALYYLQRPDGATVSRERAATLRAAGGVTLCDAVTAYHQDNTEIRASVQEVRRVMWR